MSCCRFLLRGGVPTFIDQVPFGPSAEPGPRQTPNPTQNQTRPHQPNTPTTETHKANQIQPLTTTRPRPQPSTRPNRNPTQRTTHKPTRHQTPTKPSPTRPHPPKPRGRLPTLGAYPRTRQRTNIRTSSLTHASRPTGSPDDNPEPMGADTGRRGTRYTPAPSERAPRRFTRSWTSAAASATGGEPPREGPTYQPAPQQREQLY